MCFLYKWIRKLRTGNNGLGACELRAVLDPSFDFAVFPDVLELTFLPFFFGAMKPAGCSRTRRKCELA